MIRTGKNIGLLMLMSVSILTRQIIGEIDSLFLRPLRRCQSLAQAPGDLLEWLKRHAWKVCIRETVSRVRIPRSPLSPSEALQGEGGFNVFKTFYLFHVYILKCANATFYTGCTENIIERFSRHQKGNID